MNQEIKEMRSKLKCVIPEILEQMMDIKNIKLIKFRVKTICGIKKKMKKRKINILEVDDLIGIRIIVEKKNECYKLLRELKQIFGSGIYRTKDYIKNPADLNKYQAIHLYLFYNEFPIEIQIHSFEMNAKAEAEHYQYKMGLYKKKTNQSLK